MLIVEGLVQEEDLRDLELEAAELTTQLLEGVRTKPARHEGADVLRAELHLHRAPRMQRERDVAHRAQMVAHRTAALLRLRHQRRSLSHCQCFQAVGTVRLAGNAVPPARLIAAAAAWHLGKNA